jgi:hypothetical protein
MYSINFNGNYIELPAYSFELAEGIERVSANNQNPAKSLKEKCNAMYCFNGKVITAAKQTELIGKFDQADPNDINILFLKIAEAYNAPVTEYNAERTNTVISDDLLNKLDGIAKALETLDKLNK